MQSSATFMISVITFKSPVFKENINQFHITLGVQLLPCPLSSSIYQTWLQVQSERTAICMQTNIKLSSSLLKDVVHRPRTITTRVIAKFPPGSAAHPAAAWVLQLIGKHLAAVQRHGPFCTGKWELPEGHQNAKCQEHPQLKPLPRSAFPSASYM